QRALWFCHKCQWGARLRDVSVLMAEVSGRSLHDVRVEISNMVVPSVSDDAYDSVLGSRLGGFNLWDEESDDLEDLVIPLEIPGESAFSSHVGQQVLKYAHSRGLDDATIELFGLRQVLELKGRKGPYLLF